MTSTFPSRLIRSSSSWSHRPSCPSSSLSSFFLIAWLARSRQVGDVLEAQAAALEDAYTRPAWSGGAEAEGVPLLLDERAEADGETDGDLVEGDVHDPAEQRDALAELDDGHRVGRLGREGARRDTDHGEALDGALAAEGHGLPGALVAGRTELPRRDGELPAPPAAHPGELALARALEEALQRDRRLSHGRTGSRARWRCCRRGCG